MGNPHFKFLDASMNSPLSLWLMAGTFVPLSVSQKAPHLGTQVVLGIGLLDHDLVGSWPPSPLYRGAENLSIHTFSIAPTPFSQRRNVLESHWVSGFMAFSVERNRDRIRPRGGTRWIYTLFRWSISTFLDLLGVFLIMYAQLHFHSLTLASRSPTT